MLAVSDSAFVLAPVGAAVLGLVGVWLQVRRVHREVRSPNGIRSGELGYESWRAALELREQLAEVRENQLRHRERATADGARLEEKVDHIATTQDEHLARDEGRFATLFRHLDLTDPHH